MKTEALCTIETHVADYPEEPSLQPHHRAVTSRQGADAETRHISRLLYLRLSDTKRVQLAPYLSKVPCVPNCQFPFRFPRLRFTDWYHKRRTMTPYSLSGTYARPSSRHKRRKVSLSCKVRRTPEL